MRDILAMAMFMLIMIVASSPESVGDWLRKVDEARYPHVEYD